MEYPDWLNGMITAIFTAVLTGITFYYARVTKKILKESEQMRLDNQKPRIAIYLGCEKEQRLEGNPIKVPTMYLYVENIGMGPAYDVDFDTNLDFMLPTERSLRQIQFIVNGILYLPPRQKRKLLLGHRWTDGKTMARLWEDSLEITVTYNGIRHKECKGCFCLNFGEQKSEFEQMAAEYPVQINV